MKRQEINLVENFNQFREKFIKLRDEIQKKREERERFVELINNKKEKIEKRENFNFLTFFVDGSMSKFGSKFPNFLYIFRSFAISPNLNTKIYYYELFSPLIKEDLEYFNEELEKINSKNKNPSLLDFFYIEEKLRYQIMAKLEILAGLKSLTYLNRGDLLFMDGSLSHLEGENPILFNKLKKEAKEKEVTLIGIIENIGSSELGNLGDKELLTGNLEIGEMVFVENPINKKGYSITFLRLSVDPTPISFDLFIEDRKKYKEISSFLYFITPKNGRGIPIFKDLAHNGANLSEKEAYLIIKNFIDEQSFEIMFKTKRDLR